MSLPELPWNTLEQFVKDYTKGLQEIVDTFAPDPGADNSMFAMDPLYEFDAAVYLNGKVRYVTSDYNDGDHYNGNQGLCYVARITLMNNTLHILSPEFQGQVPSANWHVYTLEQLEDIREKANDFTLGIINAYPDENIEVHANNNGYVYFQPGHYEYTNIKIGYNEVSTPQQTAFLFCFNISSLNESADGKYIDGSQNCGTLSSSFVTLNTYLYVPIMAVIKNNSEASDFVSYLSNYSTHNDVVDNGTWKIYYGDNYIVFSIPQNVLLSYNDITEKLNIAITNINGWNPGNPPIVVPTYKENKYGPEPEPIVDDDYTDMGLGVETDGMAMYNMAVVTRQELFDLITDFESNADTGLSFIPHVLGLYKLGISSSQLLTTITDKIRLHKEPGKTAFASAADYSIVYEQETYIDCGSITVDREELLTNTFLDFSPYTTYEMFIPGCGWITLPDTIVGRTLTVSIVFDLVTCSAKGIVRCGTTLLKRGTTIATVNGIIGSSVPLSINETGLQRAAIMNGSTQAAMALGTAFMGVGIGNPYMGASGVAMAASALASNHIAGNSTYTSTKGGATDYSVFGDGWKAVLKITRPVLEIPDNYGHTVGFVVNRYDTLSNFSGFTVCVNPHIHISATSDEKEEIKRLLEEGVILPEGEE